jgi:hypothetical protein
MFKLLPFYIFFLCAQPRVSSQNMFGLGAAIHLYDQVIGLKGMRTLPKGYIGMELGIGVERSLQGALAPQYAFFWHKNISDQSTIENWKGPFYTLRYQFDFQKSSYIDTYHGAFVGFGYGLGSANRLDIQLSLGAVFEQLYGLSISDPNKLHFFLTPQLQLNYYFFSRKK